LCTIHEVDGPPVTELRDRLARLSPDQRSQLEARLRARTLANGRIEPRPADTEPELSFGQERVWRLCRILGDSAAYNMCSAHRVRGPLDIEALRAALESVTARNEQLRTIVSDGKPVTVERGRFELEATDLTDDPDASEVAAWVARPLDVSVFPLFTARLWRLGSDDHIFAMLAHHLVCDGWSMSVIERQLSEIYSGKPQAPAAVDYGDFVAWERSREPLLRRRLDHWRATLDGVQPLRLPGERGAETGEVSFELSLSLSAAIDDLALRTRATPFAVLLSVFAATINRHTAQDDIVVCTPVAGRPDPALETVVGYFNDLVPIRARVKPDERFVSIVERVRPAVLEGLDHVVPFQWIAGLETVNSTPLTRALFALNDVPAAGLALPGLSIEPLRLPVAASDFELGWFMRAEDGRYRATVCFRAARSATVEALAADFVAFAGLLTEAPDSTLSDLPDRARADAVATEWSVIAQPRSLLESQLQQIWARVFRRPVGVDDDFFDLGGHSLLAAELVAEIEQEFELERIPLATLFAASTVARQAQLIERGGWRDAWASLVPIKPTGHRTPLFFVHGHDGNVIEFADLARNLSVEQPFYALQAQGMDVERGPRRIEALARTYVEEVRTVQASGPYVVGGFCLGGDIAFEMAHCLHDDGDEVALVVMVDNPRAEHVNTAPSRGLRRIANRAGTRVAVEWSAMAELPWRARAAHVGDRASLVAQKAGAAFEKLATDREGALPFGLGHSRTYRHAELAALHEKAYFDYEPRRYAGAVAIFRAERQPLGRRHDPSLGWSGLVDGPLILHSLPGHRIGVLSEPRVQRVAPIIEAAIRTVLDQSPGS
jgi:thioesterase domain-containing protein